MEVYHNRLLKINLMHTLMYGLYNKNCQNSKVNLSKSERNQMKTIVTAIKKAEKEVQDGRK